VHEKVLSPEEIERGYEVAKGRYVIVTDEDLENLPIPTKHTIEVTAFVELGEVDPLYFDKPYFVAPTEIGKKPLALLVKALTEKGVVGLAKVALRNRETLCLLRVANGSLVLEILHWPDEIREPASKPVADEDVDPKQLKMAESLIDLLADKFDPAQFRDEFRTALQSRIEAKVGGQEMAPEPDAEPTKVIDLMEALRASIDAAKSGKRKSG
jgi:DNA end-binding protein Ku